MQSAQPRTEPMKDPAKMTDKEIETAKQNIRIRWGTALFDDKHPLHLEARRMLPESLPGIVVPGTWLEDSLPLAA
jgi:hypothetical protein